MERFDQTLFQCVIINKNNKNCLATFLNNRVISTEIL